MMVAAHPDGKVTSADQNSDKCCSSKTPNLENTIAGIFSLIFFPYIGFGYLK